MRWLELGFTRHSLLFGSFRQVTRCKRGWVRTRVNLIVTTERKIQFMTSHLSFRLGYSNRIG